MIKYPFLFTKEEYLEYFLETTYSDEELQQSIFLVCDMISDYIERHSAYNIRYRLENNCFTKSEIERLKKACIYQLKYNEDTNFHFNSDGYNPSTNSFIANGELFDKYLAPRAKDVLMTGSMLCRGIR